MKKSVKRLLGLSAALIGAGAVMNTCVLTRVSKKISDFQGEMEEKKNPTDPNAPDVILRAEGDAWVDATGYDHICIKNRKSTNIIICIKYN